MKPFRLEDALSVIDAECSEGSVRDINNYAFEFASQEAEMLGIDTSSKAFSALCQLRRLALVDECYKSVIGIREDGREGKVKLRFDYEGIPELIKKQYGK